MPGRTSKLLFAAGCVGLLALAAGLVVLTRGATQTATPPLVVHPPAATAPAAPVAALPPAQTPQVAAREPSPAAPRGYAARPGAAPQLAPAPVSFRRELKRDADGNLVPMIPLAELRAMLHQTDAAMKACIDQSGQRATGSATLSFTIAAKSTKLVIDTTGVQDEETLAGAPELLACMQKTANTLVLDGRPVPELGTPIYVRRHVRLDNGALAEDQIPSFSYNP